MPDALTIMIPGEPVPLARPRARVVRKGSQVFATLYTAGTSKVYLRHVATCAREAAKAAGWRRADAAERLGVVVHVWRARRRGDLDNFVKALLDGLTQSLVVWADDAQVVSLSAAMATSPSAPRARIVVARLGA